MNVCFNDQWQFLGLTAAMAESICSTEPRAPATADFSRMTRCRYSAISRA